MPSVLVDVPGACHISRSVSSAQGSCQAHTSTMKTGFGTQDQLLWSSEYMLKHQQNFDTGTLRVEAIDELDQP